jgi:hypothetical protein
MPIMTSSIFSVMNADVQILSLFRLYSHGEMDGILLTSMTLKPDFGH